MGKTLLRVLDLFSGTGSATEAFEDRGHSVVRIEMDSRFDAHFHDNIRHITTSKLATLGDFDFVWASPPCTAFSVASIGHHWTGGARAYVPSTTAARESMDLVAHTLSLLGHLESNGAYWVMENPRGVLRKLPVVANVNRRTITYCQYGDDRMKPTDIFGNPPPTWLPRPMCKNGDSCHVSAPRGAKTGTQGRAGATERAMVPYALGESLCLAMEAIKWAPRTIA